MAVWFLPITRAQVFHELIRELSRFIVRIQRMGDPAGGFEEMLAAPLWK
jgi:hypothetical protein